MQGFLNPALDTDHHVLCVHLTSHGLRSGELAVDAALVRAGQTGPAQAVAG
ncbi:hypothetical protein OU995_17740 [Roseateles sp. SL47]|uniref:hypothetical protein n=1 Tax=Roseateles sp. SL47 TaxID=2995138 RepID=UPI00226E0494|nr:hypothetical protein [Roseateles sp. SL47]WAC71418.1 hypothetical protein OU995_17740 [Roseateles sp. SL47]